MQPSTDTYTFFKKGLKARSGLVFVGEHEQIPTDGEESIPPLYNIEMSRQSFELVQNNSNETHKVLTGKYENLLRRKALIRSEHGLSSAKRNGVFSCGWTFTYMSNEYKWSTAAFNRRWVLRDINDREIAEFTRASLAFKRIGKLEIYHEQTEPMDPEFVAMIVLSCKLVHNTAKANESRWSNG